MVTCRAHPLLLATCLAGLGACSLTPIPDLTSEWVDPCDASVRLCDVPFALKATTERSVEVRGDFRDGGWALGEPMVRSDAGVWEARLELTWGVAVQYKFYVDGSRWLTDPGNPRVVGDGKGNNNSLLDPVTCASWTCAPSR